MIWQNNSINQSGWQTWMCSGSCKLSRVLFSEWSCRLSITVSRCTTKMIAPIFSLHNSQSLQILGADKTSDHSDVFHLCDHHQSWHQPIRGQHCQHLTNQRPGNWQHWQLSTQRRTEGGGREEVRIVICGPYHSRDHSAWLPVKIYSAFTTDNKYVFRAKVVMCETIQCIDINPWRIKQSRVGTRWGFDNNRSEDKCD